MTENNYSVYAVHVTPGLRRTKEYRCKNVKIKIKNVKNVTKREKNLCKRNKKTLPLLSVVQLHA